jgi:hypothetical protein
MKENNRRVSIEEIKASLEYDPETGILRWRKVAGRRLKAGHQAGTKNPSGYIAIMVRGVLLRAHRIAFAMMTGDWPDGDIDHINCKRDDNRWENLRAATRSQNLANTRLSAKNKSGFKGVFWHKAAQKWCSEIRVNGTRLHLGYFDDASKAAQAYQESARSHHGQFARF